ncbi:MAG: nuclear transport factor 2 family protein [Candidatus Limnocylindrales bacterium]
MAEHENVALVREMNDAMKRGDMQALDGFIADDVVWHEIGRPEPRRGKAELQASGPVSDEYQIAWDAHDILASGDHAVALMNATATRGTKTLHYRTAEIYHIRDGQIAERWAFSDDTGAIRDFFA